MVAAIWVCLLWPASLIQAEEAGEFHYGPIYVSVAIFDVDSISSAGQSFTINYYARCSM